MKRLYKRGLGLTLFLIMLLSLSVSARTAVSDHTLELTLADTAQYVCERVKSPQVGSIGGEWAVLGLARSGSAVPETYYQDYYAAVERYVQACGGQLHDKKYTEYSRVILALSAIGSTPGMWPDMTSPFPSATTKRPFGRDSTAPSGH